MSNKTQAMRILEREGISYSVHNYSAAETDAVQVALAVVVVKVHIGQAGPGCLDRGSRVFAG